MKYTLFLFSLVFVLSCSETEKISIPDLSDVSIDDYSFVRFDKEVQNIDPENIAGSYATLKEKYPEITELYFKRLLNLPSEDTDTFYNWIGRFISEPRIKDLQSTIDKTFGDGKDIEKDLLKASKFLKYYFPDKDIPNFYTYLTEYGYQCIIFKDGRKDGIGIGLDLFLGADFDYRKLDATNPAFSDYLIRTYNEEHISKKVMEIIIEDMMGDVRSKRFLDQMLYNGKKLYILNKVLPEKSDTIIMEYSYDQWSWAEKNELEIWNFFKEENLIYETNFLKINKYLNKSPNSPGMPEMAPGRTANYIGWKIVEAFMRRNPDYGLQELIDFKEGQKFLEMSKYKPKRR